MDLATYANAMYLLNILLVVCTAAAQLANKPYYDLKDAHDLFKEYVQEHGKVYDPEEYLTRLEIFKESLKEINERNARHPLTEFGLTRFADLKAEERQGYMGKEFLDTVAGLTEKVEYPPEEITAPEHWDWRDHGVVSHVRDEGHCYSHHVMTATAYIEGQYAIKYNKCLSLSDQQGIDCVPAIEPQISNSNCYGGFIHDVLKHYMGYHLHKKSITLETEYPSRKGKQGPCLEKLAMTPVTNVTAIKMISTDEESLKQILFKNGPLATILVSGDLYLYRGGIMIPDVCKRDFFAQSVLLVGYGIENGRKYWIAKNSWGTKWGEKGYFRILRGVKACQLGVVYTVTGTIS